MEEKENGSLLMKFTVTQEFEVEGLIKQWVPHLKIISPKSLHEKIKSDFLSYIN